MTGTSGLVAPDPKSVAVGSQICRGWVPNLSRIVPKVSRQVLKVSRIVPKVSRLRNSKFFMNKHLSGKRNVV